MNKLTMAVAASLLLAAGSVLADGAVVTTQSLQVKQRLQNIERIDVTAEKPANPNAEPLDDDLVAILDEVAKVERDNGVAQKDDAERGAR